MDSAIDNNSLGSDEEVQHADGTTINETLTYQAALQDLKQPKTERDLPPGVLSVPLMRHQKIALEWMRKKETRKLHCLGGILADDQGLGKTISTIALIQFQKLKSQSKPRKPRSRKSGGTLIVCPVSVVKQWARELDDKVSYEHKLSVLVYHGSKRTKDPIELAKHDVVVTTYAIVTNEVPQNPLLDDYNGRSKKRGRESTEGNRSCCSGALARVKWLRVVLDEAHIIKNHKTLVAKACFSLRAKRRWCLSGTPIQNKVEDLYSYIRFLRYHPYAMYKSFCKTIKGPLSRNSLHGYKKLQAVLRAIMLRRTKGTLLDGKPLLNLPSKIVNLRKVDFSVKEWSFYRKIELDSRLKFEEYAAAGTLYQNYADILLMLLRLRQACNHPQLVRGYINSFSFINLPKEALRNVPRESLIRLLNLLKKSSSTICYVCSNPPEDPVVTLCGHVFCHECVFETITGDEKTCPVPRCREELGPDAVFSKSKLRSCIRDYDDHHDDKKALRVMQQSEFISSKIKALVDILESHSKQDSEDSPAIKTIVFSQWTGMLDLVEHCFVKNRITFRRLDGAMSLTTRDRAVKEFNNDPDVQVMLMSLKAGNLGLNMVAACHVILLDLWWNPTTEDQAIDRAHRIGQTRTVTVTRITIKNTVDDRILALQESKRKMVASALGENHGKSSAIQLTVEDLEYLFFGV